MIIDFHVHCFPDSLAPRALSVLRDHAFENDRFPCTDGTVSGTEAHIKSLGVDRAVVCNIATNGRQQHKVNTFAISIAKNSKTLYSLGSLHPDGEDKKGELELLRKAGIRGIKLHPDYIGIDVNETAYNDIFELCSDMNFFVVLHAGLDPVSPEHIHASPRAILDIHTRFPKLRIIAAHMGGFRCSDETIECLLGKNIWFDTSMSSQRPNEVEKLRKILHEHDPNRLLFASDTPWAYETEELKFLYSAKLGDKLNERILSLNALQLLG